MVKYKGTNITAKREPLFVELLKIQGVYFTRLNKKMTLVLMELLNYSRVKHQHTRVWQFKSSQDHRIITQRK